MKAIITQILFCLIWLNMVAQTPQAFKYQAVARNSAGEVLGNKPVSFRISILSGSATGTAVYTETHAGITTNSFGLVDLEIGKGALVTGTFAGINWGTNSKFMKVEMDPNGGSAYQSMGTSQLLSVPYALYARDVENNADGDADATNELQKISISGTVLTLDKSGGSVTLPSGGTSGDNWGTQTVVTDATLTGNGTTAIPLKIADNGVTSAKILDGSIETSDLADQTVSTAKLGNLAVSADKIQNGAVITDKLANGSVTGTKIAQASATDGQVLKWNNTTWSPANDNSSLWQKSGSKIYYNNGYVGIGTVDPKTQLDVRSSSSTGGIYAESVDGWSIHANSFLSNGVSIAALTDGGTAVKAESSGLGAKLCSTPDNAAGYFSGNVYMMSGKVGVGTTNPQVLLDVRSKTSTGGIYAESVDGWSIHANSFQSNGVSIAALTDGGTAVKAESSGLGAKLCSTPDNAAGYFTGNVYMMSGKLGVGTSTPDYKFHVFGDRMLLMEQATSDWIALRTDGGTNDYLDLSYGGGSLVIQGTTSNENILMNPSMNKVGIRTWTPQYDLDVNGNIRAIGSVYYGGTTTTNGSAYTKPDYVFGEEYPVLKIEEVETFLQMNNHLPWVTSVEQEKKENGGAIDMTRMAFETLEALENLQLQLITQNKLIGELKTENDLLKKRLKKLEKLSE